MLGPLTQYAVVYNHQEMSQFLVDSGADPLLEDKEQASGNLCNLRLLQNRALKSS